ncbi:MAG: C40 family peptidase [Thermoleophilia bacterium]|nr:C40 family peptidase [Thermoleophilia bacterium]
MTGQPRARLSVRLRFVLPVAVAIVTLLVTANAAGTPRSEKKAELQRVKEKLGAVYLKADLAVEKYNMATAQLADIQAAMRENEHLLDVAEFNQELAKAQLETRACMLYKSRGVDFMDVLFASSSFDEFVSQLDLMRRLGDSDVDMVRSIAAYEREIRDRRLKLAADKEEAARLVAERKAQKDDVLALQERLERLESQLTGDVDRLRQEAAAAAAAAAAEATGEYPQPVDPGGSGHSEVVGIAMRYLGVPYVYGGASPSGFDCSGLTMYCYAQIGYSLPHSATMQAAVTTDVPLSALQPGDLIFFGTPDYSSHVAIYIGGGQMIHASSSAGQVIIAAVYDGAWIGGRP